MSFAGTALGEAYINEYWVESDDNDLGDILTLFALSSFNRDPKSENKIIPHIIKYIFNLLSISKWNDWFERSSFKTTKTETNDANTISHHYDISNEFYKLFLNDTMVYSCAIFDNYHNKTSLNDAQKNKINILYNKMGIEDRMKNKDKNKKLNILEIGSGWGYTSSYFSNKTKNNANILGITLSNEQLKFSKNAYSNDKNLKFEYLDYRKLSMDPKNINYFDGIISIGMLEHVHLKRIEEFFNVTSQVLAEDGVIALHYITRNDIYPLNTDINNGYYPFNGIITRKNGCNMVSFISKYIFPGGCLLLTDWVHEYAKKYNLIQVHKEYYGLHYAKTLNLWRQNFNKNWNQNILKLTKFGYDQNLFKIWNFYLANCEAVFRIQYTDLVQQIFIKSSDNKHNQFRTISNVNQQIQTPI